MSSSEQSSSSESDNDSIPDIHKLQPYDLEPEIASSDVSTTTSDENTSSSDSEIADYSRIANTSWCSCGKCFSNVNQCQLTLRVFAVATQMK